MVSATTFADSFAGIALAVSAQFGGPFHDARVLSYGAPETDAGGSIVPGTGGPSARDCSVQVDKVTEAMRQADGFTEKDQGLFVLASTLDGAIDTDMRVEVLAGPHAGTWLIDMVNRDPAGVYWECRGRAA